MKIRLRYFASIRETIGQASEVLDTSAATAGDLREELIRRGGVYTQALARGRAVRVAVRQTMSPESTPLQDGDEVAFFPPVTGG